MLVKAFSNVLIPRTSKNVERALLIFCFVDVIVGGKNKIILDAIVTSPEHIIRG